MAITMALGGILLSSIALYFSGNWFSKISSRLGDYCGLPRDVKGATFDAISSSLPELLVALYSVIFFHQFEVGIGTIAGSALFNLLVIPGIAVFVAPVAFKVSKKVISRDALFYSIAVATLIILLLFIPSWGVGVAIALLCGYGFYTREVVKHTKEHKKKNKTSSKKSNQKQTTRIGKDIALFVLLLGVIGGFTFILTHSAIELANSLGIAPIIIAFTIIAAATSVPDTIISIANARRGDIDDATSNVFGSNVFDIFVGIGLPLLLYSLISGSVIIAFAHIEIVIGLLVATLIAIYFFLKNNYTLTKKQALILLALYALFVAYVILIA